MRGGTEEDIEKSARMNGADLEKCSTCNNEGKVVENAGYCGGCEICGSIEERLVDCPDCIEKEDEEEQQD